MLGLNKRNSKRTIVVGIIVAVVMIGLSWWVIARKNLKNLSIDSNVNYSVFVPTEKSGTDICISLPFYRLCSKDNILEGIKDTGYTVGDDAFLEGRNVDTLNGMQVSVTQKKLSDCIDNNEEYKKQILQMVKKSYGAHAITEENKEKAESYIDKCIDSTYVISIFMTYDNKIASDVEVKKLSIPSINLTYDVNKFNICMVKNHQFTEAECDKLFDFSVTNGSLSNSILSKAGYYDFEGKTKKNLKSVQLYSLNDGIKILNENELSEKNISVSGEADSSPRLEDVSKNKSVESYMYYWYTADTKSIDAYVSSLLLSIEGNDGQKASKLIYQPSFVDGEYYVAKALKEYLTKA